MLITYRRQSRRGSDTSRNSHSSPDRCIHFGACRKFPAWMSNAAPTPTSAAASTLPMCAAIHRSCLGVLRPIHTICAPESLIACTAAASSSSVIGRNGGEYAPTIFNAG